jgi:hypothetical protein
MVERPNIPVILITMLGKHYDCCLTEVEEKAEINPQRNV